MKLQNVDVIYSFGSATPLKVAGDDWCLMLEDKAAVVYKQEKKRGRQFKYEMERVIPYSSIEDIVKIKDGEWHV